MGNRLRVMDYGLCVMGYGFRALGSGFRVLGSGFWVLTPSFQQSPSATASTHVPVNGRACHLSASTTAAARASLGHTDLVDGTRVRERYSCTAGEARAGLTAGGEALPAGTSDTEEGSGAPTVSAVRVTQSRENSVADASVPRREDRTCGFCCSSKLPGWRERGQEARGGRKATTVFEVFKSSKS